MRSKKNERDLYLKEIQKRIESNFQDCVVIWRGTGLSDEDYDNTEVFEALWIRAVDYDRLQNFIWDLEQNYAQPKGFSIMVHSVSPKVTKELRWDEYKKAMSLRGEKKTKAEKVEKIRK